MFMCTVCHSSQHTVLTVITQGYIFTVIRSQPPAQTLQDGKYPKDQYEVACEVMAYKEKCNVRLLDSETEIHPVARF